MTSNRFCWRALVMPLAIWLVTAGSAACRGEIILTFDGPPPTVVQGQVGASFNLLFVRNDGLGPAGTDLNAFSLVLGHPDLIFTGATVYSGINGYVFNGIPSLGLLVTVGSPSPGNISLSDLGNTPADVRSFVNDGDFYGVATVTFNVSPTATVGTIPLTSLLLSGTDLSRGDGTPINDSGTVSAPISQFLRIEPQNGSGDAIPEPGVALLSVVVGMGGAWWLRRRGRNAVGVG